MYRPTRLTGPPSLQPCPKPAELTGIAFVAVGALVCGIVVTRLRQPAVVGYIFAGVLLGPSGFAFVENRDQIAVLAELGVLLLLFVIGMELSLRGFARVWRIALMTTGAADRDQRRGRPGAGAVVRLAAGADAADRLCGVAQQHRGGDQDPSRHQRVEKRRGQDHGRRVDRPGSRGRPDATGYRRDRRRRIHRSCDHGQDRRCGRLPGLVDTFPQRPSPAAPSVRPAPSATTST